MRAALDDSRIPMTELLVAHGADLNAVWGGHYPVILGPCETYAPRALKWLLDHGADLHAAAKYSDPVGMIVCIYSRNAGGKHACLEIVSESGFTLPDTPVMALHRGRLDLLQEHLDRDPSLLTSRAGLELAYVVWANSGPICSRSQATVDWTRFGDG
jgi:hypothetical protein